MIPIRDNIQPRRFPYVNYAMIAACTFVFAIQLFAGADRDAAIVERWGLIPARLMAPEGKRIAVPVAQKVRTPFGVVERSEYHILPQAPISDWLTLLSCMFLHGGFWHFLGNVWFLHIFGDNVEDRLGHVMYAIAYIGCGLVAGIAHLITNLNSPIPTIGASGAIAGVMGAYLLLYPRAKVLAVIPLIIFFPLIVLPAPAFLGIWFLMQFLSGATASLEALSGGVAWWAHVGGFVAGVFVAWGLLTIHRTAPEVHEHLPGTGRVGMYDRIF